MTTQDTAAPRTVSSEVTVGVDPQTAFSAFTEEIDLWWVRGPINFHDGARAIGMRCEPGVGGRLLELYSEDGTDALVLGRITAWQPGELLAWDSGVDDVTVEVRFRPVEDGTTVTVTAAIPADGVDKGGTAWVRVVPRWLGDWVARRGTAGREPSDTNRLGLALYYEKPVAAARWLADAFGFGPTDELGGDEYEDKWIEFRIGNCSVMLFPLAGGRGEDAPVTHVPWVFVDDLDAHLEHARSRGATIVSGIRQHGYRAYEAADLDGNRWTFVQARPTMPR
jgi:uncharacterized glyoxalase superfamily protein PhnB/uncharacterized protein YndB with AHSA1/START domain